MIESTYWTAITIFLEIFNLSYFNFSIILLLTTADTQGRKDWLGGNKWEEPSAECYKNALSLNLSSLDPLPNVFMISSFCQDTGLFEI